MKKLFVFLLIGTALANTVLAQKLKESQVPAAAKSGFQKAYPNTAATWEKENENYEVNFKKDGKTMSVIISKTGAIAETETDIAIGELPETVQSYVKKNYKGAKIKEAAKIVKAGGDLTYEAEVNGKDVIFDSKGQFLKEVKE